MVSSNCLGPGLTASPSKEICVCFCRLRSSATDGVNLKFCSGVLFRAHGQSDFRKQTGASLWFRLSEGRLLALPSYTAQAETRQCPCCPLPCRKGLFSLFIFPLKVQSFVEPKLPAEGLLRDALSWAFFSYLLAHKIAAVHLTADGNLESMKYNAYFAVCLPH